MLDWLEYLRQLNIWSMMLRGADCFASEIRLCEIESVSIVGCFASCSETTFFADWDAIGLPPYNLPEG